MSLESNKRRMADGSIKVYRYHRISDLERARAWLERAPLTAEPTGKGHAVVWRGRTAKHTVTFQDRTICKLICEGYAICLGQFVEKRGIMR
jgi:hypothetical protein